MWVQACGPPEGHSTPSCQEKEVQGQRPLHRWGSAAWGQVSEAWDWVFQSRTALCSQPKVMSSGPRPELAGCPDPVKGGRELFQAR